MSTIVVAAIVLTACSLGGDDSADGAGDDAAAVIDETDDETNGDQTEAVETDETNGVDQTDESVSETTTSTTEPTTTTTQGTTSTSGVTSTNATDEDETTASTDPTDLVCADEGVIVVGESTLYNEIDGEPIMILDPGSGVLECGESDGWFAYASLPPGIVVDCTIPVQSKVCPLGWSPVELDVEIAG